MQNQGHVFQWIWINLSATLALTIFFFIFCEQQCLSAKVMSSVIISMTGMSEISIKDLRDVLRFAWLLSNGIQPGLLCWYLDQLCRCFRRYPVSIIAVTATLQKSMQCCTRYSVWWLAGWSVNSVRISGDLIKLFHSSLFNDIIIFWWLTSHMTSRHPQVSHYALVYHELHLS